MLVSMKKIARRVLPKRLIEKIWPWGGVHSRDATRCGWYNGGKSELFPGFTVTGRDTFADIGCGDGAACGFAASRGATVIGADIDPDVITRLRQRLEAAGSKNFRAIISDGNPLPIESGIATRVVCQEVLEHVPDPAQFMSELVRIGRPGARYLLTVPDPVSESMQKKFAPPAYWAPPNHVRVFQREEFSRLVVDAGLRIEKRTRYGFYWAMWWTLFWGAGKHVPFGSGGTKPLALWNQLWGSLIADPKYAKVVDAFEDLMPKSQIIIAVKD